MAVAAVVPQGLLEREDELRALDGVIADAGAGRARALLLEGPAGIGKSALLAAAVGFAAAAGLRVLRASGGELERDFVFGVARQLFEPCVASDDATTRAARLDGPAALAETVLGHGAAAPWMTSAAERESAALHGLYWLTANLAGEAPLLLAVDDVHWADPPSLRMLLYLLRRIRGLPVALVLAARPADTATDVDLLLRLLQTPELEVLRPGPLSASAVRALVAQAYASDPESAFVEACATATGGSPFLVHELVTALRNAGTPPTAAGATAVPRAAPETVRRSLMLRLAQLPAAATTLAEALAVLGGEATTPEAAAVAGLADADAAVAASALIRAGVLTATNSRRDLHFAHALLRAVVYDAIPGPERSLRHSRAAEALRTRGASVARVALQLAACEPRGDPDTVDLLRAAAAEALAQGAPDVAADLLGRALAEPPPEAQRGLVLRALGSAELQVGRAAALEHLQHAHAARLSPADRAAVAIDLARAHEHALGHAEAVALLDAAAREPGLDRELRLRLEAEAALIGRNHLATRAQARERVHALAAGLAGDTPAERLVLAAAAQIEPHAQAPERAADVARTAERQLAASDVLDLETITVSAVMLVLADRLDAADAVLGRIIAQARERGWTQQYLGALVVRAQSRFARGAVAEAHADVATGLEAAALAGRPPGGLVVALAVVRAAQGDLDGAEKAFGDAGMLGFVPEIQSLNPVLYYRGDLRLGQGRPAEALADLHELGDRYRGWGYLRPVPPWRSTAARCELALGRRDVARALAAEELELARAWGTPRALAVAERALGLIEGGDAGLARLRSASEHAAVCPSSLELAESELALGAALRRSGQRVQARRWLSLAMDRAHASGAAAVAGQARVELRASGGRPRRAAVMGSDALTPSERRIAEMAAQGMSNRRIAQALFVTVRTVETHLGHAFQKLGAKRREELADRLAAGRVTDGQGAG